MSFLKILSELFWLFIKNKLSFPGAIYRTDCWKTLDLESLSTQFGKWGDRPIMIEVLQGKSAIILLGDYVFYGRHELQDTRLAQTQSPHTLWLNRERYFKGILSDKLSSFSGLCFCTMSHRRLKSGYKRRIIKGLDFKTYLQDAFSLGSTTGKAWRFRYLAPRLIQTAVNAYAQKYLRRHHSIPAPDAT